MRMMLIPIHHRHIVHKEVRNFFMTRTVHPFSGFELIVQNIYDNSIVMQEIAEEYWIDLNRSLGITGENYEQLLEDFDWDNTASDYVKELIANEVSREQYLLTK